MTDDASDSDEPLVLENELVPISQRSKLITDCINKTLHKSGNNSSTRHHNFFLNDFSLKICEYICYSSEKFIYNKSKSLAFIITSILRTSNMNIFDYNSLISFPQTISSIVL